MDFYNFRAQGKFYGFPIRKNKGIYDTIYVLSHKISYFMVDPLIIHLNYCKFLNS